MTKNEDKKTAAAGIAGAIIGAGVTAAAVALSDKENRKKVVHTLKDFKVKAEKAIHKTHKKADEITDEMKEKTIKAIEKEQDALEKSKQIIDKPPVHPSA